MLLSNLRDPNDAIGNAEAVTSGITFDISAKKGLKKRFLISSLVSDDKEAASTSLFHVDDETVITLSDGGDSAPTSPVSLMSGQHFQPLSTDGIGGLLEQIKALNLSMERVLKQVWLCQDFPVPQLKLMVGYADHAHP